MDLTQGPWVRIVLAILACWAASGGQENAQVWFQELHCWVLLEGMSFRLTVHKEEGYGTIPEGTEDHQWVFPAAGV